MPRHKTTQIDPIARIRKIRIIPTSCNMKNSTKAGIYDSMNCEIDPRNPEGSFNKIAPIIKKKIPITEFMKMPVTEFSLTQTLPTFFNSSILSRCSERLKTNISRIIPHQVSGKSTIANIVIQKALHKFLGRLQYLEDLNP